MNDALINCESQGKEEKLNESHVILVCPCVSNQQRSFHNSNYIATTESRD